MFEYGFVKFKKKNEWRKQKRPRKSANFISSCWAQRAVIRTLPVIHTQIT